jgi:small neutral amino acid transporter SnatA (MarC family)
VNTRVGSVLLFVVGAVVAQLGVFGGYLDYVKLAQGPLLIAAGLLLALLGIIGMRTDQHGDDHSDDGDGRQRRPADERRIHTHGPLAAAPEVIAAARQARREARRHDHRASPPVAVLLIIPVVMALGVSPPPLGAFTAARAGAAVPAPLARRCPRQIRRRYRCTTTRSARPGTADERWRTAP